MERDIDFKSLRASVVVHSEADSRWNFHAEKTGNSPPDPFSLRPNLVNECSEKLYELRKTLGTPPHDLVFTVTEEWSSTG